MRIPAVQVTSYRNMRAEPRYQMMSMAVYESGADGLGFISSLG
jgi:hypothetical protein